MFLDKQQHDFFTTLLRGSQIPKLVSGANGEIYWVNKAFEDFIGYNSWELTIGSNGNGLSCDKISVQDDNLAADKAMLKEAIAGNITSYSVKELYIPKNEKPVWVDLHIMRYPISGDVKYFIVEVIPLKNGTAAAFNFAMSTIKDFTEKFNQNNSKVLELESKILDGVVKQMESRTETENIFLSIGKLVQKYPKIAGFIVLTMLLMVLGNQMTEAFKNAKTMLGW